MLRRVASAAHARARTGLRMHTSRAGAPGPLNYPRVHELKDQLRVAEDAADRICQKDPGQACAIAWDYVLEMRDAIDRISSFDEDATDGMATAMVWKGELENREYDL